MATPPKNSGRSSREKISPLRRVLRMARGAATSKDGIKRLFAGKPASPFLDEDPRIIIHTSHHKVGTSWFSAVFRALSANYEIPLAHWPDEIAKSGNALFLQHRVFAAPPEFADSSRSYRGSHMIRDPRDVVISGYHYHLWTKEPWCNTKIADLDEYTRNLWRRLPIDDIGHLSYKEYLNTLSPEEGLLAEIKQTSNTIIKDIADWNYDDPNIFEFRYEDIMLNEEEIFRAMFEHYGFSEEAVDKSCELAAKFSFSNRTGRAVGDVDGEHHIRSGKLSQWKNEFKDSHKALFKELNGESLIKLGYEDNHDW